MTYDPQNLAPPGARIKVIGVGGGGGNAINTMIRSGLEGVDFISCNTDVQALRFSLAPARIQIGKELTRGLGAGADPDIGRDAALEDRHEIQELLTGADMVFITAGMGGGTGTGGASVVAQIARELGALTVAVVTKPFQFEGNRRRRHGDAGVVRLRECVDTLITIPNQRLLQVASPGLSMIDAFKLADEVLVNAVRGISDIINIPGTVNVDFADVKTVMSCMGQALMGIGHGHGEKRALEAAKMAISSPLLEDVDIEGATGILINITAGANVTLMEVNEACSVIQEAAHEDANIIFGAVIDETLGDQIRVTVIATGFPVDDEKNAADFTGVKAGAPLLQPYANRLTTPSLITPKATAHRPPSQHLTNFTPKRPEAPKPTADAYAFQGGVSATMKDQTVAPTVTTEVPKTILSEPLSAPKVPEPKSFFDHAAATAPAASHFDVPMTIESEAQDLTRLTLSGAVPHGDEHEKLEPPHPTFQSLGETVSTSQEPSVEPIASLANPLIPGFEPVDSGLFSPIQDSYGSNNNGYYSLAEADTEMFADTTNDSNGTDEQDGILLSEPAKTVLLPNELEIIVKKPRADALPQEIAALGATETLSGSDPEVRLEGARAIVDPADDFLPRTLQATLPQQKAPSSGQKPAGAPIVDSLFDDIDTFLADTQSSRRGTESIAAPAPLDSFFSSETAAIAGDIDRKINEALELAERMKNPAESRQQSKSSPADDLDVPAFLRNGMKDLPLG